LNFFMHTMHVNGLSPVCVRMWRSKFEDRVKFFSHTRHANERWLFFWNEMK
jgi:hypothetical protein